MNNEQERAAFEAWMRDNHPGHCLIFVNGYLHKWPQRLWEAYQAGRAALQSQDREDAQRFRWLTEDHTDAETRTRCREILDRMAVMGYSAACDAIDHARCIEGIGNEDF